MPESELSSKPFPNAPIACGARPVQREWLDYNDHMNVGYYALAFDQALDVVYEEWLGFGADYVRAHAKGPFALQQHFHYLRELRLGEEFTVAMQLLDHDEKRAHFVLMMSNAETGALCATCEQVSIHVDHATRRSTPYPPWLRARLAELMAAHRDLAPPATVGRALGLRRGKAG